MRLYHSLQRKLHELRSTSHGYTPASSFASSPSDRPASPEDAQSLSSPTLPSEDHFSAEAKNLLAQERGHFTRDYSGRQVWIPHIEDGISDSMFPSPRSSPPLTVSPLATYPSTPVYLSLSPAESAFQLRSSLLAILASSSLPDRWNTLCGSFAIQILRSTTTPLTHLPQFESHLTQHLSNTHSSFFQDAEEHVLAELYPHLQKLVKTYTPLTSLQIFELATAPKNNPSNTGSALISTREEVVDVATRMAHIGTLHWRVWAPLAYLVDPDAEENGDVGSSGQKGQG